jgi:hypothetical protein
MEDVDRLEDVLEAVVTGAVNTRHAAYLSAKAGLSRVELMQMVVFCQGVAVTFRICQRILNNLYSRVFNGISFREIFAKRKRNEFRNFAKKRSIFAKFRVSRKCHFSENKRNETKRNEAKRNETNETKRSKAL